MQVALGGFLIYLLAKARRLPADHEHAVFIEIHATVELIFHLFSVLSNQSLLRRCPVVVPQGLQLPHARASHRSGPQSVAVQCETALECVHLLCGVVRKSDECREFRLWFSARSSCVRAV